MKTITNINTTLTFIENTLDQKKIFCSFKFPGIDETMVVHLESEKRVVYNPNHLNNRLPNRSVFDSDLAALKFISAFGYLLNNED